MMKMNSYVKEYKKKSRRSIIIYFIIALLFLAVFFVATLCLVVYQKSLLYLLAPAFFVIAFDVALLNNARRKNINVINNLLKNNLDVDLVLESYEQLIEGKKGKDFPFILVNYLKTLLLLGEYEKFIEVYKSNQRYTAKINLSGLKGSVLALKQDRSEYRESLFEHKFSKYRKVNTRLPFLKEELKVNDQYYEIMQLYEIKEYRKVIEKIDSTNWYNTYNKLFYRSYRERSLYHLNEIYAAPDEDMYPFAFVTEWKHLIETGEEYTYEKVDELLEVFEQNKKSASKTSKKIYILSFIYLLVLGILLAILTPEKKEEKTKAEYIKHLSVCDYETTELYGFRSNADLAGAILYGNKTESGEDVLPGYIFTRIDYYKEGFTPKMKLDICPLLYLGGTQLYALDGDNSSYVTILTDDFAEITYDGKAIVRCVILPKGPLFLEPYSYSFITDEVFDINLLRVNGEKLNSLSNETK